MNLIQNINNKSILISALDWGFGHTTRCVSIINDLLSNDNTIIFAGNNTQVKFIRVEFPSIKCEIIEGYNINLSSEESTYFQIAKQGLKIAKALKTENIWVKNYVVSQKIDLIISDNRYGFRHTDIKSIFIGHQLNLEMPSFKNTVNNTLINYINKFDYCWIPDDQSLNLSGKLSNTKGLKIPFDYIGLLTRFEYQKTTLKYDYLFIVSGPNPENMVFLKEIEKRIKDTSKRITIVSSVQSMNPILNTDYFYLPSTKEMNEIINQSKYVVSKSGYTTIMELVSLNKKAILIPTKGQFEQEYLAKHIKHDCIQFIESLNQLELN